MKKKYKQLKDNIKTDAKILKAGSAFFVGSIVVAILNFLYHFYMGRMLGPENYGILASLLAIIYILTFASLTFNKVISKFVSEYQNSNLKGKIKNIIKKSLLIITVGGFILLIFFSLFANNLAKFMHIKDSMLIIFVGTISFVSMILSILIGALNGLQYFWRQNIINVITTIIKLVLGIALVTVGFSVKGALFAILVGSVVGIFFALKPLSTFIKKTKIRKVNYKRIVKYIIPVGVGTILPILLISLDQIFVKHYFTSIDAGLYIAASTLGKIIWVGSGFFVGVIFPKVSANIANEKNNSEILIKTIFYTAIIASIGCMFYFIMPTFIVTILYGQKFIAITHVIGLFGLTMGFYSIIQVIITYNLAIEKYDFIIPTMFAVLLEVLGIIIFHNSTIEIIKILFGVNVFLLMYLIVINKTELRLSNV